MLAWDHHILVGFSDHCTQGPYIARTRAPKIRKQYEEIGGKSPIGDWTRYQGSHLVRKLEVRRLV